MSNIDLVKRLRTHEENISNDMIDAMVVPDVCIEAANYIEKIEAELAEANENHKTQKSLHIHEQKNVWNVLKRSQN